MLSSSHLYSGWYSDNYGKTYNSYFQRAGAKYLPEYDWQWFKAQGIQESLLVPDAVSSAGAVGVMQIMPGTWRQETEELGIIASPTNPKVNILVGVRYMKKMVRFWKAPRTEHERLELAQASYNAGAGNILKAQLACNNPATWSVISLCLSKVTGRYSAETLQYVRRIARLYKDLTEA